MSFQFDSVSDFFNMGGYAFFVWASFICTFLCMFALYLHSVIVSKKIKQGVQKEKARAQRILAARLAAKEKRKQSSAAKQAVSHEHSEVSNEPKA